MTYKGYMSFFTLHEEISIPDTRRQLDLLIKAMKLVMRVYNHLEEQYASALDAGGRDQTFHLYNGTVLPCMFSPKKLLKGSVVEK